MFPLVCGDLFIQHLIHFFSLIPSLSPECPKPKSTGRIIHLLWSPECRSSVATFPEAGPLKVRSVLRWRSKESHRCSLWRLLIDPVNTLEMTLLGLVSIWSSRLRFGASISSCWIAFSKFFLLPMICNWASISVGKGLFRRIFPLPPSSFASGLCSLSF